MSRLPPRRGQSTEHRGQEYRKLLGNRDRTRWHQQLKLTEEKDRLDMSLRHIQVTKTHITVEVSKMMPLQKGFQNWVKRTNLRVRWLITLAHIISTLRHKCTLKRHLTNSRCNPHPRSLDMLHLRNFWMALPFRSVQNSQLWAQLKNIFNNSSWSSCSKSLSSNSGRSKTIKSWIGCQTP